MANIKKKDTSSTDTSSMNPAKEGNLFRRWKDPSGNKMGNNISPEIKIADHQGKLEGEKDKEAAP